ncbi:hypothetical protein C0Z16_29705 [Paraburkholderia rhynchosiae]|uniref:Uncharacterized protein n=1 Tax=Paraburkholderia rhynchosiae TaxID=487049 RepID=A0ABX4UWP6_9BURK|nr:hypothetical protein C0Z16_29705 [Paraburkholderia rhynchosiae]
MNTPARHNVPFNSIFYSQIGNSPPAYWQLRCGHYISMIISLCTAFMPAENVSDLKRCTLIHLI